MPHEQQSKNKDVNIAIVMSSGLPSGSLFLAALKQPIVLLYAICFRKVCRWRVIHHHKLPEVQSTLSPKKVVSYKGAFETEVGEPKPPAHSRRKMNKQAAAGMGIPASPTFSKSGSSGLRYQYCESVNHTSPGRALNFNTGSAF